MHTRLAVALLLLGAMASAQSAQTPAAAAAPPAAPAAMSAEDFVSKNPGIPRGKGFQAEFITEYLVNQKYIVDLAERIPQEKYTWRPAEGVRSISEVLLHVSAANFRLATRVGGTMPEDVKIDANFDKSTTDKAQIVALLKRSFLHFNQAVAKMTDEDANKTFRWFGGSENNNRGFLQFVQRHTSQHVGQMIAYSRMVGVVPPWTEEAQQQQQRQQQSQPPAQPKQ